MRDAGERLLAAAAMQTAAFEHRLSILVCRAWLAADCSPAPGGMRASLSQLSLPPGLRHIILPWSPAPLADFDFKEAVFSEAQWRGGSSVPCPWPVAQGLSRKGRGAAAPGSTPPSLSRDGYGELLGGSYHYQVGKPSISTGCAPAVALVRCHHAPWGWGDMVLFGSVASMAEKEGTQLHCPQGPPAALPRDIWGFLLEILYVHGKVEKFGEGWWLAALLG